MTKKQTELSEELREAVLKPRAQGRRKHTHRTRGT